MIKAKDETNELRDITRIKNKVKQSIKDFETENETDTLKTENQNVFSAFCMDAGKQLFIDNFFVIGAKGNATIYDVFLLDSVCDLYIYFCRLYNKTPSLIDFSALCNIDYTIIRGWKNTPKDTQYNSQIYADAKRLYIMSINGIDNYNEYKKYIVSHSGDIITLVQRAIFDKLQVMREDTIKSTLLANKNPVGILAVVNNEYKWNVETIKEETRAKAISLQELPQLNAILTDSNN